MQENDKVSFKKRLISEREQLILEVARRMFAEKGYHGTNLNDVASEVGIARGTIYLHFETKDELLSAIIRQAEEQLLNALNQVIKDEEDPLKKLRCIMREYLTACHNYEDLIKVMSYELREAAGTRLYGDHSKPSVIDLVEDTIEEAKKTGVFDKNINTLIASRAFFSIVTIQAFREAREKGGLSVDEIIDSAMSIYFHGIGGRGE